MSPLGQSTQAESSQSSRNPDPLGSIIDIDELQSNQVSAKASITNAELESPREMSSNPPLSQQNQSQKEEADLVDVQLTSVLDLREEIEFKEHEGLTELFREHCFVGCVDHRLATIQHRTRLLLVDYHKIG